RVIVLHERIESLRKLRVVKVEGSTSSKENKRRWNDEDRVGPRCFRSRLQVWRGKVALYEALVATVGDKVDEKSTNQHHPDRGFVEGEVEIRKCKLSSRHGIGGKATQIITDLKNHK